MKYILVVLGILFTIETVLFVCVVNSIAKKKSIEKIISFFRDLWGKFVFYAIATSIIGLFLCSIVFKERIELNIINTWISIILGLVALVIGIISLFLSFYNLDQANMTQEKTVELIQQFKTDMIDHMHELQNSVEHKIDESSEKTREEIKGSYRKTTQSYTKISSENMTWEDEDE